MTLTLSDLLILVVIIFNYNCSDILIDPELFLTAIVNLVMKKNGIKITVYILLYYISEIKHICMRCYSLTSWAHSRCLTFFLFKKFPYQLS